ncbi:MAG: MFS transporter [Rubrivivax sp.]|nr:MAG: MFS transporter [Rubrivivax sp.]
MELERRTMRKVMWRLLPLMALMFLVNQLDRVNVSFAALTMNRDIGLDALGYAWGAGIFFIAYFAFEVPSNLVLERIGARLWIARIMITWGIISGAMALVVGQYSFLAMRFLLGAAEAGFVPGLLLYITYWFPRGYRARATAIFFFSAPLGNAVAGLLSIPLLAMDGIWGLKGWQWMFIAEALPALLLGVYVLKNLPDKPRDAAWLAQDERTWLEQQLASGRADHGTAWA